MRSLTISEYLRELRAHLRVGLLERRRILREVEEHLAESAEREGEVRAIESFGTPQEVAERFMSLPGRLSPWFASALGGTTALALALAIAFGGLSGVRTQQRVLGKGTVSSLDRPQTAADRFTPAVGDFAQADVRRVYADQKRTIWLAPTRNGSVCYIEEGDEGSGMGCARRSALRTGAIYNLFFRASGAPGTIMGVVDDNVEKVGIDNHEIPVHNNVFVADGIAGGRDSLTLVLQTARVIRFQTIAHLNPASVHILPRVVTGSRNARTSPGTVVAGWKDGAIRSFSSLGFVLGSSSAR
jgi:hypothetical protein